MEMREFKELLGSINQIQINLERLDEKIDQINNNIEKLEVSVEKITKSVSDQDTRITVLEQKVPENLPEDMALLKQSQKSTTKFLWIVAAGTVTAVINIILGLLK